MTALFPSGANAAELGRGLLQSGLSLLFQTTFLLAAGLLAARLLATQGPALRSLVYRVTLAAVAASVVLAFLRADVGQPLWRLSLPHSASTAIATPAPPTQAAGPVAERSIAGAPATDVAGFLPSAPGISSLSAPQSPPPAPHSLTIEALYVAAALVWAGGTAVLLAWLLFCHLWLLTIRRRSVPIQEGAAAAELRVLCAALRVRQPQLLASARVRSPFLTGLWRPAIMLPAGYETTFDAAALRAILIHELTHMARRDCAWNLLARFAAGVLWVQPLLWMLIRRLEQGGEEICDQAVLQREVDPGAYAECLLQLAERLVPARIERAAGAAVVPFRSSLGRRVTQILDRSRRPSLSLSLSLRAATILAAAGVMGVGLSLVSAAPSRPASGLKGSVKMAAAEKPMGGPVSGRVVTPDGQPVSGALVSWISRSEDGDTAPASIRTDSEGSFRFEDTGRWRHKDDYPQIMAEAAGWGLSFEQLPDGGAPIQITLNPAAELHVPFLDPDGRPASGLEVRIVSVSAAGRWLVFPSAIAARLDRSSDARGVVSFPSLPQGYQARLDVRDERYAHLPFRELIHLAREPATQAPPIRLEPGATVLGRISFGPTGKPASGILAYAQAMGPGEGWADGVSDANGEYRLTQLLAGAYNVALGLKDETARSWTARAHEGVYLKAGERRDGLDFALIHGAVIRGRVIAADTGEPIPNVFVSVYGPAHPQSSASVQGMATGPDGAYLQRVPGGKQYLYISSGTAPPGYRLPANTTHELTLRDGETAAVDFKLPRGGRVKAVHGRVLGPDGKPVANAQVLLTWIGGRSGPASTQPADANGSFSLGDEQLREPVALRARHQDLATPTAVTVTGGETVTLRLQKNALVTLSGRVTGPTGQPIAHAPVTLIAWAFASGGGSVVADTDAQGRYSLHDLWPDLQYSVDVSANGYSRAYTERAQFRPGETRELPPLVLKIADRSVAGRVVDEKGDPVVGAQVNLNGRDSVQQMIASDGDGKFRFDGVVDEKVVVQAYSPGHEWGRKNVPAGSMDLVLVLIPEKAAERSTADPAPKAQFDQLLGRPAPELHAVAWLNSPPRSLRQLRGKVVLIDFWATGCGPCVASLPGVQRAADEFRAKGVIVIGLHAAGCTTEELQKFAHQHQLTFPLAIDAPDEQKKTFGKTFREYTVVGIPSVGVIDRNGKVAYLGNFLEEAIGHLSSLLAQRPGRVEEGAG